MSSDLEQGVADRLALVGARARSLPNSSVRLVRASLHREPVLDPGWEPDELNELLRLERGETQFARIQRRNLRAEQLKMEEHLHRSFLLPAWRFRPERELSDRDFASDSYKAEPDEWLD
jgi:hypothetical protein